MRNAIFTVGHSTHAQMHLLALLERHAVTAVSDVRSRPYSRMNAQFNREELSPLLKAHGISYVFLGRELGARSEDPACYDGSKVDYGRLMGTTLYQSGIERILTGALTHRIALLCAEKEPLDCHRTILVGRSLAAAGAEVQHIHPDGHLESQGEAVQRLMLQFGIQEANLFLSRADLEAKAYEKQEARIAYTLLAGEQADAAAVRSSVA